MNPPDRHLHIVDTTVLSNFARVGRPDLLRIALGEKGAIPALVRAEWEAGVRTGRVPNYDWSWLPTLALSVDESRQLEELSDRLDPGEANCIVIAISRQATVVTDDQAARRYATRNDIAVSGTLGMLARLIDVREITIDEADELLSSMIEQGFRSPVRSLKP